MRLLLAAMFVAIIAGAVHAIPITTDTAAPSGAPIQVEQTTRDSSSDWVFRSDSHQYFGQTWTAPESFIVDKISVLVFQEDAADRSTAGLDVKVDLWNAATLASVSGASILGGGENGLTPDFPKGTFQWITYDITNTAVTGGSTYGITFDFASEVNDSLALPGGNKIGGADPAGMQFVAADAYASGAGFRITAPGDTNNLGTADLAFVVQGFVPEPSSFVLASLALVGLVAARYRRKRS